MLDHMAQVIREHKLTVDIAVRLDKINILAAVDIAHAHARQLTGEIRADVLRAFHAQQCINAGGR